MDDEGPGLLCMYKDDSPLHCAITSDSIDVVKLLLENDAKMDCVNEYNRTPLIAAFYKDRRDIMDLLISYYDFKKYENTTDDNGISHFHVACSRDDVENIKYLLEKGVNVNGHIHGNSPCHPGYTPLFIAVKFKCCKTAELLFNHGADIGLCDANNKTVFDLLSFYTCTGMIDIFLQSGIDINSMKNQKNDNPFHILCNHLRPPTYIDEIDMININLSIQKLYNLGCDINHQNIDGNTPLHLACQYEIDFKFIKMFLDFGSDINIENTNGQTPFVLLNNGRSICKTRDKLTQHITKLKAVGYYVSEQNTLYFSKYTKNSKLSMMRDMNQFLTYLIIIRNIQITNYTSMYDILFADANKMALLCENKLLITALNKLENEPPADLSDYSYVDLLKLQLKKGISRRALLKPAIVFLRKGLKIELSYYCLEKITSYLTDADLKCLLEATYFDLKMLN